MKGIVFKISILFVLTVVFMPLDLSGQPDRKNIRGGNSKYRKGEFASAESLYRKAIEENKNNNDAQFNLGNSLYRQDKLDEASETFTENAERTDNLIKKSNAFYNLGNTLLKGNNPSSAIEAYKNSLMLNPGNLAAKYNLAYAQDLLKNQEKENKEKNQDQEKQDQDQDKQNDEKKPEEQEKEKEQDKKDEQKNPEDKKDDQQEKNNNSQSGNKGNENPEQQPQSISKEDANRLLDALANDEKKVREKVEKAKGVAIPKTKINW